MDETALFSGYKSQRPKGHKKKEARGEGTTENRERLEKKKRLPFLCFFSKKQRRRKKKATNRRGKRGHGTGGKTKTKPGETKRENKRERPRENTVNRRR
jgi:hypothetical protein